MPPRGGDIWELLYCMFNFSVNLELLLKIKPIKKIAYNDWCKRHLQWY